MPQPIDKYAAFLAHKFVEGQVAGELYVAATAALAATYKDAVLSHMLFSTRLSSQEAADHYFDAVLCRPVLLSGGVQLSVSHKLFAALAALKFSGEVQRQQELIDEGDGVATLIPPVLQQVEEAMRATLGQLSKGCAAASIQSEHGKLYLCTEQGRVEVAEELSFWQALLATVPVQDAPLKGEPFNRLCRLFIDTLRTVHRPYQEVVMAGLYPFEWMGELTTNQVRSLRRFCKQVDACGGSWREAWLQGGVTGFKCFEDFDRSELAMAIRDGFAVNVEQQVLEYEPAEPQDLMPEEAFAVQLAEAVSAGVVEEWEAQMITRLYTGESASQLLASTEFALPFKQLGCGFDEWADDVVARCTAESE